MKVFREQQKVLQENARAILEKAETPNQVNVMQMRTKQMIDVYAIRNPMTNQQKTRYNKQNPANMLRMCTMHTVRRPKRGSDVVAPLASPNGLAKVGRSLVVDESPLKTPSQTFDSFTIGGGGLHSATVDLAELEMQRNQDLT